MNHITIIQDLINKNNFKNYLEIGIELAVCFNQIICENKRGVDPDPECRKYVKSGYFHCMPSDVFFGCSTLLYDVILVDGLHLAEQTLKDIENALNCLNEGGYIIVHDCNPPKEDMQIVPRGERIQWTGDVWKAWVHLRRRPDLSMKVMNCDYGCGIIQKGSQEPLIVDNPDWTGFVQNKKLWLNLVDVE